jgi:hypothetical protein
MSTVPQRQLLRSAPYFPVADVGKSAEHYERVLGFRCAYAAGDPPEFAILERDGLSIMLRRVTDAEKISPNEKQGGTWDVFFWVSDIAALDAEMRGKQADIVYGPTYRQMYHMMELAVRDSDGYVLGFGQDWRE